MGFGEYDILLLQKSLQNLARKTASPQIRFWGKIRGTEKDYYVAEGKLEAGEPAEGEEPPEGFEARGSGVNANVYWVCNNPLEDWVQLPDLKPSDIIDSRSIKVLFSGDVNRKVFTNPFFMQSESVLLRAQISRITHSTQLTCKGLYRLQEEDQR